MTTTIILYTTTTTTPPPPAAAGKKYTACMRHIQALPPRVIMLIISFN